MQHSCIPLPRLVNDSLLDCVRYRTECRCARYETAPMPGVRVIQVVALLIAANACGHGLQMARAAHTRQKGRYLRLRHQGYSLPGRSVQRTLTASVNG
jgi:hypothetical protein